MEGFAAYLKTSRPVSEATRRAYLQDIRLFSAFLSAPPSEATAEDAEDYVHYLQTSGRAAATVRRILASLCAYYDYLVESGKTTENPWQAIPRPAMDRKLPVVLSGFEMIRLLSAADGREIMSLRDRAILELLYATGITASALLALNLDSVNLRRRLLTIRRGGTARVVPFGRPCGEALGAYMKTARPLLLPQSAEAALFLNYTGHRLSRQGLWKLVKKYKEKAGIDKEITPHTLRHSFAAHLLENGADLATIGELLGVSDPASTAVYPKIIENKIVDIYQKAHPRA